jgi:thiol-disulfide isomerase/thioredoxin
MILILAGLLIILVIIKIQTNQYTEGFESGSKSLVICKADWCGHCKKAAPEFNKLVSASPISLNDGSNVVVKMLDADQDKSELSNYKVRGYPTILIMDGSQVTEYPGERTHDGVMNFLNSMK